ncbi:MAG: FAD:protein FMN transferase [Acidobacteria bacterium]|nr:FAD:protein FMN transferase [Acidobacteriota bacterium]
MGRHRPAGHSAIKSRGTARVDVGGNAKGYAIDLAVRAMQAAGARGGLVDVGGDLRFFGEAPDGVAWTIDIRHPDGRSVYRSLALTGDRAVCTSGNYARFAEIGGRRFSHIIDPRSGWPADATPSVTVIGPDTLTVDTWATALSVLGPEGLARLPENLDALILTLAIDGTIVEHRSPSFPQP